MPSLSSTSLNTNRFTSRRLGGQRHGFSGQHTLLAMFAIAAVAIGCGYAFLRHQGQVLHDLRQQLASSDVNGHSTLNDPDEREILQRILFLDSQDEKAWERLAQVYLRLREFDQLPLFFARWENEFHPAPAALLDAQGDAAYAQGQYPEAISFWLRYRERAPEDHVVWLKIAQAYAATQQWEQAQPFFQSHYEKTHEVSSRVSVARCLLHRRQWALALDEIKACNAQDPGDSDVKKQLPLFERVRTILPIITAAEEKLKADPTLWPLRTEQALRFFSIQLPNLTLAEAKLAGDVQPLAYAPRLLHALALYALGETKFAQALKVRPVPSADENAVLALLAADQKILTNSNDPEALAQRATALNDLLQYEWALADAQKALELNPGQTEANLAAATAFLSLQQYLDALLHASAATGAAPENARGWLLLGQAQQARADLSTALTSYNHSIQIKPIVEALRARAECYRQLGDKIHADEDDRRVAAMKKP